MQSVAPRSWHSPNANVLDHISVTFVMVSQIPIDVARLLSAILMSTPAADDDMSDDLDSYLYKLFFHITQFLTLSSMTL